MDTPYITDSLGHKWELVEFFDHDSQQYLVALKFVPNQLNPTKE